MLASFLVLFAAEWGDLSQLLTISLVAKYEDPVTVFIGALGALLVVSGLAVVAGRALQRFVTLHVLHYIGAGGLPAARRRSRRTSCSPELLARLRVAPPLECCA